MKTNDTVNNILGKRDPVTRESKRKRNEKKEKEYCIVWRLII
jgi:hypothetical protein